MAEIDLLTIPEVCNLLRINRATFFVRVAETMPSVRIGRRRLVRRCDLDAWVAAQVEPARRAQ